MLSLLDSCFVKSSTLKNKIIFLVGFWIIEDFLLSKSKCSSHEKIPTRNWARNTRAFVISKQNNHDFLALPSSKHNYMLKINVSERWKFSCLFSLFLKHFTGEQCMKFLRKTLWQFCLFSPGVACLHVFPWCKMCFPSGNDKSEKDKSEQKCSNEIVKRNNVKCERMSKEYM